MTGKHEIGKRGEEIASKHLTGKGYTILETNWQSNHQEIDIIARKNDTLVVVEVKSRSTKFFGTPESFVTKTKQRMLIKAANHYIAQHKLDMEVRFDIISILFKNDQHLLNQIEDAFYPTVK